MIVVEIQLFLQPKLVIKTNRKLEIELNSLSNDTSPFNFDLLFLIFSLYFCTQKNKKKKKNLPLSLKNNISLPVYTRYELYDTFALVLNL